MTDQLKKRCNFYGCTIPAGIAHHHPLNGPVMRDPSAPLDDVERAELEMFRAIERNAAYRQVAGMKSAAGIMWECPPGQKIIIKQNTVEFDSGNRAPRLLPIGNFPQPRRSKRRTFSQQVGTIAVWILACAGSLMIVGYAALEAVTALGWAS